MDVHRAPERGTSSICSTSRASHQPRVAIAGRFLAFAFSLSGVAGCCKTSAPRRGRQTPWLPARPASPSPVRPPCAGAAVPFGAEAVLLEPEPEPAGDDVFRSSGRGRGHHRVKRLEFGFGSSLRAVSSLPGSDQQDVVGRDQMLDLVGLECRLRLVVGRGRWRCQRLRGGLRRLGPEVDVDDARFVAAVEGDLLRQVGEPRFAGQRDLLANRGDAAAVAVCVGVVEGFDVAAIESAGTRGRMVSWSFQWAVRRPPVGGRGRDGSPARP